MRLFILLLFFSNITFAAQEIPKPICITRNPNVDKFLKNLVKDSFYKFAIKRSALASCGEDTTRLVLNFNNGDRIIYDITPEAPGIEVLLSQGIPEQQAFNMIVKSMPKVNGKKCSPKLSKPTEIQQLENQPGQRKIFWCKNTAAVSVSAHPQNKAIAFRSWMVH